MRQYIKSSIVIYYKLPMYSKVLCETLRGINGVLTYVEADSSNGLPNFLMVGNLASSVKEAGDRVKTALKNSNVEIPALKSLEMIPANVSKIINEYAFIGELNLNGDIVGVRGILSMVSSLKDQGIKGVVVPKVNEQEALVVEGIDIISVDNITELLFVLSSEEILNNYERPHFKQIENVNDYSLDFHDISGQTFLKRACEVAVAGFHNIIISGSAGTGKTMIAKRIPTIMPSLTIDEAIEITKVYSVAGELRSNSLMNVRPFRNPHHSISITSLIGGGIYPRPGEISLASNGVLFLDELPHFSKMAIETLREPLEEKSISCYELMSLWSFPR